MSVKVYVKSIYYNFCHEFKVYKESLVQSFKSRISDEIKVSTSFFRLEADLFDFSIILNETFPISFYFPDSEIVILRIFLINLETSLLYMNLVESIKLKNPKIFLDVISDLPNKYLVSIPGLANKYTLLHLAASIGCEKIICEILKCDPNLVNQLSSDGWTPLMLACVYCHFMCCKELINSKNIKINLTSKKGSALDMAIKGGCKEILEYLLVNGAFIYSKDLSLNDSSYDKGIVEILNKYLHVQERFEIEGEMNGLIGEFFVYKSGIFKDKKVVLRLSKGGCLEEYDTKVKLLKNEGANIVIPLSSTIRISTEQKNSKKNYFFQIFSNNLEKIYYCKLQEQRDKFTNHIKTLISSQYLKKPDHNDLYNAISAKQTINVSTDLWSETLTLSDFDRTSELGVGSYGSVYKILRISTGDQYAMKCLSKSQLSRLKMLSYAEKEIEIMKDLNHPFILKLFYSISTETAYYLILEYCEKGDLDNFLNEKKLTEHEAKFFLAEILLGLEYLHSKGIIYRDLKPENILIAQDGHIRLADFGLAKEIGNHDQIVSTIVGSPAYMSPELLDRKKITKAVDIYSFGIVMHQVLTGKLPYNVENIEKVFEDIRFGRYKLDKGLGKEALGLVKILIQKKASKRPGYEEIKNHGFFKGIDWNLMSNKQYLPPKF